MSSVAINGTDGNAKKRQGWLNRSARKREPGFRGFLYWWFESEHNKRKKWLDGALVAVIVMSIVVIIAQVTLEPEVSAFLDAANAVCLTIFIIEYLCRFLVNTDFTYTRKNKGLARALLDKLRWMVRPFSIIDLVALVPAARSMRTLRLFRLLRLARLLRILKLARYSGGFTGYVQEFRKKAYEFLVLGFVTAGILTFAAITIFCVERPAGNEHIRNIGDAFWWSTVTLTTVGYGDAYPVTGVGRIVAGILMFTSIGTIAAMGGLVTSIIMERIKTLRAGRAERATLEEHIVFCGWTQCAAKVAKQLVKQGKLDETTLVVLTARDIPDEDYMLPCKGDFTDPENLAKVDAARAEFAVIFHETGDGIDHAMADRKAMLAVLQIEALNGEVHTITELFDEKNAEFVKGRSRGDEVIPKERIDAGLIVNTIVNAGHTSEMLYDLSDLEKNGLQVECAKDLKDVLRNARNISVGELKSRLLQGSSEYTFLGYLPEGGSTPVLNPPPRANISADTQLYLVGTIARKAPPKSALGARPAVHSQLPGSPRGKVVFLGWNICAAMVLDRLLKREIIRPGEMPRVLSQRDDVPQAQVQHVRSDYSDPAVLEKVDWRNVGLVIIYHESRAGEDPSVVDIRNTITTVKTAPLIPKDAKIIVELFNEAYADVIRQNVERDVEVIYKERIDANFIANTIVNPGKTTQLLLELTNLTGNRIKTLRLSDFGVRGPTTVKALCLMVAEREPPVILLGALANGEATPVLNPSKDTQLTEEHILYCVEADVIHGREDA